MKKMMLFAAVLCMSSFVMGQSTEQAPAATTDNAPKVATVKAGTTPKGACCASMAGTKSCAGAEKAACEPKSDQAIREEETKSAPATKGEKK